jgi:hypothetical protein
MKKGRGREKIADGQLMSVTAAISPYESIWRGRRSCLGFLVYLFAGYNLHIFCRS